MRALARAWEARSWLPARLERFHARSAARVRRGQRRDRSRGVRPRPRSAVSRARRRRAPGSPAPSKRSSARRTKRWKHTDAETGLPGQPEPEHPSRRANAIGFPGPHGHAVEEDLEAGALRLRRQQVQVARGHSAARHEHVHVTARLAQRGDRTAAVLVGDRGSAEAGQPRARHSAASIGPLESRSWPGPRLSREPVTSSFPVMAIVDARPPPHRERIRARERGERDARGSRRAGPRRGARVPAATLSPRRRTWAPGRGTLSREDAPRPRPGCPRSARSPQSPAGSGAPVMRRTASPAASGGGSASPATTSPGRSAERPRRRRDRRRRAPRIRPSRTCRTAASPRRR